ncbi:MAG: transcription elongation factor GreB [Gammaproteobacteria bacterium]|nr:transcription elongation factor GreB [Gammaproteobacteria bacterium]
MSRYRPPQPPKSPYITGEGYRALESESKALWVKRAEVTRALSAAAAEGDRSENAEYIYRKKELRDIDGRIRYLQKRMPDLQIVDSVPSDTGRIFFGAWVTLENERGETLTYRIVGPDELDLARGFISMDAPLARCLLKRSIDDEVVVQSPGGERHYWVVEIDYSKNRE